MNATDEILGDTKTSEKKKKNGKKANNSNIC
jgi:hypothetical protein